MSVLIDRNVLTRLADRSSPQNPAAAGAVKVLLTRAKPLVVVPQVFYEFGAVATRPVTAANGLGMTSQQAKAQAQSLKRVATLLFDDAAVFNEWERLALLYDAKGKAAHDTRLAAAMNVHGVKQILTFNGRDFARFEGITVLDPTNVAGPSTPPPVP